MVSSFSLGYDGIGWRQSKTTGDNILRKVVVRQFARDNMGILVDDDQESDMTDTQNNSEMKKDAEQRKFPRMAKVLNFLEMLQHSQNLPARQMK